MFFKNQKFLVAGMSKSGQSATRFLLKRGAEVYMYDDFESDAVNTAMDELEKLGARRTPAQSYEQAAAVCDILVLSPGIPIDTALPVFFRRQGKAIIGEEELASLFLRATAIAVTGTNGKTTTVTMMNEILTAAGVKSLPCGNIGNPLISEVENLGFDDFAVIEVSSFQLETLSSLRPHIAVVTNISEDHLNRHYNMENYIYLKSKLLRNLRESEYAVLNYDDQTVRSFSLKTKAKIVWFSMNERVEGAYYEDGALYFSGEKILSAEEMGVRGAHNICNALACIAISGILGIDKATVKEALCNFRGIRHRMERVCEVDGVAYIDDSKGTNVDASVKAASEMDKPTVMLLGGKDKGYDYVPLFSSLLQTQVIHAVIYGENRFKMMDAAIAAGFLSFSLCSEFKTAVILARYIAKSGQNVLLSPASSSFDSFANYEERGDCFKRIAEGFSESA